MAENLRSSNEECELDAAPQACGDVAAGRDMTQAAQLIIGPEPVRAADDPSEFMAWLARSTERISCEAADRPRRAYALLGLRRGSRTFQAPATVPANKNRARHSDGFASPTPVMPLDQAARVVHETPAKWHAPTADEAATRLCRMVGADIRALRQSLYDDRRGWAGRWDPIYRSGVIYHATDPLPFLRICFAYPKPGGRLILETKAEAGESSSCAYSGVPETGWNWYSHTRAALGPWLIDAGFPKHATVISVPRDRAAPGVRKQDSDKPPPPSRWVFPSGQPARRRSLGSAEPHLDVT
ncbi:MAG: hypothetical protein GWO40_22495 [Gammaproteobacteria bacterium]|nr:hypothetical protein [Gammaproteobacteria bacterium]NIX88277.1 hypothetical protein [Gammaproteobacteria bacterium]